jgi:hypothetical protein
LGFAIHECENIRFRETHLRRVMRDYIRYNQEDRIHDSLDKDTPKRRPLEHILSRHLAD